MKELAIPLVLFCTFGTIQVTNQNVANEVCPEYKFEALAPVIPDWKERFKAKSKRFTPEAYEPKSKKGHAPKRTVVTVRESKDRYVGKDRETV